MSLFSQEAIQNGTFVKFLSLMVIGMTTMGGSLLFGYLLLVGNPNATEVLAIVSGGIVFFSKASGVVDGTALAQQSVAEEVRKITTNQKSGDTT